MDSEFPPTTRRLFLGIPASQEESEALALFQDDFFPVEGIRFSPFENLHVTVQFIGAVQEEVIPNLISLIRLSLRGRRPFALSNPRWTYAPNGQPPRMIWIRYHKEKAFSELVQTIRESIGSVLDLPQQFPDPIPHITVARMKPQANSPLPALPKSVESGELLVRTLILWESILTNKGSTYQPLAKFQLN